jgi:hypothetical protein
LLPKFLAGYSGKYVDAFGYINFFTGTACLGVPVLLLVWLASRVETPAGARNRWAAAAKSIGKLLPAASREPYKATRRPPVGFELHENPCVHATNNKTALRERQERRLASSRPAMHRLAANAGGRHRLPTISNREPARKALCRSS